MYFPFLLYRTVIELQSYLLNLKIYRLHSRCQPIQMDMDINVYYCFHLIFLFRCDRDKLNNECSQDMFNRNNGKLNIYY